MTDADKIMHPQHFGTDPTDIRSRIYPRIWIQIPDHFCFNFWRWRRFTLSKCSCLMCVLTAVYRYWHSQLCLTAFTTVYVCRSWLYFVTLQLMYVHGRHYRCGQHGSCHTVFLIRYHILVKYLQDGCFRTHEIASKMYEKSLVAGALPQTPQGSLQRSHTPPSQPTHQWPVYQSLVHCSAVLNFKSTALIVIQRCVILQLYI